MNDLLQVLGHARPVVGVQLERELDVETEDFDCYIASGLVLEDHPRMWHLFNESRGQGVGQTILVLDDARASSDQLIYKLHVDGVVADLFARIELMKIILHKAAEAMIEGGVPAVATLELIPGPRARALVLESDVLYLLHLVLLVQEFPNELLVLDVPVIQ